MKIVQIGIGGWGKQHTRILSQLGKLSAVCDINPQRSKEYGEKYSVNHYESLVKRSASRMPSSFPSAPKEASF